MRIDPVTLRLFLAVTELGTIAAAAEREHITASAVSKRLSDLEIQLQAELFTRSNKGIEPTSAGAALQGLARTIINELDGVGAFMRDYARGARGLVRILSNPSCIAQFLPGDLRHFDEAHPNVQLRLEERISTDILRGVAENAADVGFYADLGTRPEGLLTIPYRKDQLVVVAPVGSQFSKRRSIGIQELLEHRLIGLQTGSYIHLELMKAAGEFGTSVKLRMQVNSYDAVGLMVEAGMGLGVMPKHLAQRYSKALKIKPIRLDAAWAHRQHCMCVRSRDSLSSAAKLLVEHLESLAQSAQ